LPHFVLTIGLDMIEAIWPPFVWSVQSETIRLQFGYQRIIRMSVFWKDLPRFMRIDSRVYNYLVA
jgi:hypothetical protein